MKRSSTLWWALWAVIITSTTILAFECHGFSGIRPCNRINAYSSPLFRTRSRIVLLENPPAPPAPTTTLFSSAAPSNNNNNNDDDHPIHNHKAEPEAASFPTKREAKETSKTLWEKLDSYGQSLKPRAMEKKGQLAIAETRSRRKLWLGFQACAYFSLFIAYRAYRGMFVLLPAVFREVYTKMETLDSPFVDEPGETDVNPETGKLRWRTRITVSILAAMVTLTYMVGGMANVLAKFVKSLTQTSSPTSSFEAAADETTKYENKIEKMTNSASKMNVNGTRVDGGTSPGPLSP